MVNKVVFIAVVGIGIGIVTFVADLVVAVVVSTDVVVDGCVNVSIFLTRYVFLIFGVAE